jgi:hypothetical protein
MQESFIKIQLCSKITMKKSEREHYCGVYEDFLSAPIGKIYKDAIKYHIY